MKSRRRGALRLYDLAAREVEVLLDERQREVVGQAVEVARETLGRRG